MAIRTALLSVLFGLFLLPFSASANPNFPAQQTFNGQNLTLNGMGVRTKAFFSLYTAGLYLNAPSTDATTILAGTQPMALRMQITSGMITSPKMEAAVRNGFKQAVADTTALQERIEQLIAVFKEPIKQGDIYDFIYTPQNTVIVKNGQNAATIAGTDFAHALFAIWIGAKPAQATLKSALLGENDEGGY